MAKQKKCKVCGEPFTPYRTTQRVCNSIQCAIEDARNREEKARLMKEKEERKYWKEKKEKLKSKTEWLNEAQTAFNAYIRERDKDEPCISCGTIKNVQYCAGHYFTRGGHPELRFSELNVHKQCNKNCNLSLSGNIAAYRKNLLTKIGQSNLDWLEGPHKLQNLSIDDAKQIKKYYKDKLKWLKAESVL